MAGENLAGRDGAARGSKVDGQIVISRSLLASVQSFKEAGIPLEQAAVYAEKLNEISLVTGKLLEGSRARFSPGCRSKARQVSEISVKFASVTGVAALAKDHFKIPTGGGCCQTFESFGAPICERILAMPASTICCLSSRDVFSP